MITNVDNYSIDVIKEDPKTGVKNECIFNSVKNFHTIINQSADLMHDGPEGVIPYTLGNILVGLIDVDKLLTIEEFNHLILAFPYGEHESNKPRLMEIINRKSTNDIKEGYERKIKFKQSASESMCLLRYLGVIIGQKIPRGNKHWKIYKLPRKIFCIFTYPNFKDSDLAYLDLLISKHNR